LKPLWQPARKRYGATVIKNNARDALVDLLRQQAVYVQGIAFDDLAMLLSSGFLANSTSRRRRNWPDSGFVGGQ